MYGTKDKDNRGAYVQILHIPNIIQLVLPLDHTEYNAKDNHIPPKKQYDMDDNEMEPGKEEILTESTNTLTKIDYIFLFLFIGQFLIIWSFGDVCLLYTFFASTLTHHTEVMTSVWCVH